MSDLESFLEKYEKQYGFVKTLEDYDKTKGRLVYRKFMKKLAGSNSLIESFDKLFIHNIVEIMRFPIKEGSLLIVK